MRLIRSLALFTLFTGCLNACFTAPDYPITPQIEYNNVVFKDLGNPSDADTLILTINFQDGDGDLGLDPLEIALLIPTNTIILHGFRGFFEYQVPGMAPIPKTMARSIFPLWRAE